MQEREIRIRAIEAAVSVAAPSDDIGNLLIHADWIVSYVETGRMPEIEGELPVARRIVQAA